MNFLLKYKLKQRLKELNTFLPNDYEKIIQQYQDIQTLYAEKIVFSWFYAHGSKTLNASSSIRGLIILNIEWAVTIIIRNNEETLNAFKTTIGHELTHKENDLLPLKGIIYDINGYCFIAWCNEVHADFGAVVKFAELDRNKQIQAMEYKLNLKKDDKPSLEYPSWRQRIEYVKNYDFDEILIRKIAKDTNCNNEKLIQKVIDHFEPIHLK